jgi:hypothetical protein
MSRVIALVACGLALAACSSWTPSWELFKSAPPTAQLRIESEPPGADARTSQGQSCRTPCEVTVQAAGDFTVSFALPRYQPQTVSVRVENIPRAAFDSGPAVRLTPNPVYAELQLTPPPKKKRPVKRKRPRVSTAPTEPPPDQPPSQPSYAPAAPAPAAQYPWPAPPTR